MVCGISRVGEVPVPQFFVKLPLDIQRPNITPGRHDRGDGLPSTNS